VFYDRFTKLAVGNKQLACVAGVNGEKEGERERGRKMGFSPAFFLPFPFPVYACYAGCKQPMCSTKGEFIGSKKQRSLDLELLKFLTFK